MKLRMQFELNEKGQALIVITLIFFFAFLVFAALGVDGTIIYLRRRQLQNMADAAALAAAEQLSQSKNEAVAYQKAIDSIDGNGGRIDWYSTSATPNPLGTNVGSGLNLTKGIQITDACDVRVALQWSDMGTYFTQFFGRETLQVGARAHAACNRAGGLMPIAIKRFGDERDWNMDLKNVNDATVYCDECNTQEKMQGPPKQGLGKATEFLRPMSETNEYRDTIEEWPEGENMYAPPLDFAERSSGAPGREFWILGGGVGPNQGTTSYSGLVNLDIRHVSAPPVLYYNGVGPGTQSNTLKDLGEYYIRRGYCCDIPVPGEQVAMYNGVSASFSPVALQQTYNVGDVIAVIVYNGHVFDTPHLKMTGEDPIHKTTYPTTDTITLPGNVLTYSIHLEALNGFQSSPSGLCMEVGAPECPDLGVDGLDGFADWSLSPTTRPVLGRNGIDERWITLTVTPTTTGVGPTAQVITGTRMFYVSDIDDDEPGGTGIRRYLAGIASIGDEVNGIKRDKPAVTCYPTNSEQTYPFVSTVIGQQAKYELKLDLWGVVGTQDVTVKSGALPSGFEWVNAPPWTRGTDPSKHPGSKLQVNLKVNSDVVTNTIHTIPLTVSSAGVEQSCELYVLVEEASSTVKEYVEILGYAEVEIMGYYNSGNLIDPDDPTPQSANAVRGRVISELMSDPSELTYGLRARLIPWDY
jgi:Flp pilus assembly protein TadG